ncbi:unnamed protein product [Thlaspi arvense]|uniref:Amino acid transporter transmembrane domain-containing protein n=1 Tax=Thlaspi arvense TaxID=13288 RepID=A0AAU9T1B5_THLAR|nr:unnamed protein product [Thlaspi arvense]
MRQGDIFEQEREILFQTDEEERQTELSGDESFTDSSSSPPLSRSNSHSDQWPRSYRKSMDMLTGITPPTTTSLVSFFNKKQQSSVFGSFSSYGSKQLLLDKDYDVHNNSAVISVPDLSFVEENRTATFFQSVLNGINILCGVAILTIPYAVKEGGWLGLFVLFCFGIITCYTGILLQRCLESSHGLHTYLDIGQAAFGTTGRILISGCCVEYIIMMSDNLSGLFPMTSLNIIGVSLDSTQIFAIVTTFIVLPTVWLRDLSLLSYLSGSVDGVGFRHSGQILDLSSLPVAVGIFGFGFTAHSVFPNIYSSMKEPSQFPMVLLTSFGFCTLFYIGLAVCGYTMFGDEIQSQFTLNLPQEFTSSKIAIWTAVVTPMMKYALTITPVVLSLEELMPSSKNMRSKGVSLIFRTILVLSTLVVALAFPFFATVAALIGSFIAMLIAFIFPCLCYLRISKDQLTNTDIAVCIFIIIIGVVSGCCGTYSAIARLIHEIA